MQQRGGEQANKPRVKAASFTAWPFPQYTSGWNIKALPEVGLEAQLTGANLFSCCALIAFDCVPVTQADSRKESYSTYGKFLIQYIVVLACSLALVQFSGEGVNSNECE